MTAAVEPTLPDEAIEAAMWAAWRLPPLVQANEPSTVAEAALDHPCSGCSG